MDLLKTNIDIAEKITGEKLTLSENPKVEIIEIIEIIEILKSQYGLID